MKTKLLNFKALAIMMACLSCALSASAYDFYSGGIYYTKLASNTVEVAYRDVLTADYSGSVTIPATVTYGGVTYTVKGIGYCAFGECTNLTSVTFPNTLTYIGELAFIRCSSLTSANIPSGVTWIGSNAFCYCYELESVTIPSTVTTIGYSAFTACKMSSITIPSSVVSIGNRAFDRCNNLELVLCSAFTPPTLGDEVFGSYTLTSGTLVVNNLYCKGLYEAASGWSDFSTIMAVNNYNFQSGGLYYCQTGNNTVAVCAKDENYNTYSGIVTVPPTVTYSNKTYTVTEVAPNAFRNCSGLTQVYLPYTVTKIGDFAFCNSPQLTKVEVPTSSQLTTIGNNVCAGCSSLTSFTFPETLLTIGSYAFNGCSGLTSVTIPDNVTTVGASAFSSCTGMTSVSIGKNCTSLGEWCFMECTALRTVTSYATTPPAIGYYTFRNNDGFTTATLRTLYTPYDAYTSANYWRSFTSVTRMGYDFKYNNIYYRYTGDNTVGVSYYLFGYNSYYGTLTIPSQVTNDGTTYRVTSICDETFFGCANLTSISIPNSITRIEKEAFYNCSGLTSITIPSSVNYIGDLAFMNCTGLTRVNTPSLTAWMSIDFYTETSNPLKYAHNLYVQNSKLETLAVPSDITYIKKYAFTGCTSLTSVVSMEHSLAYVGPSAFQNCTGLQTVTIGSGVYNIFRQAFTGCSSLTSVICRSINPPTIESNTFDSSHYSNATLTVPHYGMSDYQAANYWKNFTTINDTYDVEVNGIYYIVNNMTAKTVSVWYNNKKAGTDYSGNVVIPSTITESGATYTVTVIGENAFYECPVTSVTLPSTITKIDQGAFHYCSNLTSITIPDNVTTIGLYAFEGCTTLAEVNFGNGLTSIAPWAFMYCRALTSIVLPASLTSIGGAAFSGCTALNSITSLAYTPPTIESSTFDASHYSNASLTVHNGAFPAYFEADNWKNFVHIYTMYDFVEDGIYYARQAAGQVCVTYFDKDHGTYSGDLIIPETVTHDGVTYTVVRIGSNAFTRSTGLTSVTIPATVKSVYYGFFNNGASGLTTITCLAIEPPTEMTQMTAAQYAGVNVIVPKNSVAAYQADAGWGQFANIQGMAYDFKRDDFFYEITAADQVSLIRENSNSYKSLTTASIPASVTLADITYNVTAIGTRAFYQCTNLESVEFGSNLKSIGNYAFYKCTGLTGGLPLNEGLESIGNYAFAYCSGLVSAIFPYSVSSIGDAPFAYCTSLAQFMRRTTHYPDPAYKVQGGVVFSNVFESIYALAIFPGGKAQTYAVPSGTKEIGAHAFRGSIVKTVTLPTTVTKINDYAFDNCAALTGIEVNKGVTTIGSNAFSNCTSMSTVILPSTLTSLGAKAFNNDNALISIGCKAKTPPVCQVSGSGTNAFSPFDVTHFSNARLRVPTGYKSAYQTAAVWKLFSTITESSSMVDEDVVQGDVNGDGVVNISDVTVLISYAMSGSGNINAEAADLNSDGNINISDVTLLINMVMSNR